MNYPHAAFTSVNPGAFGDPDASVSCKNGNPLVNCNIYTDKLYVWLNGGPAGSAAGPGEGTYFFAVLSPSGQNNEVNDGTGATADKGTPHNLSDDYDAYTDRSFTVDGSGNVTFIGSGHDVTDDDSPNAKIRLYNYANTLNPGGVYILAICKYQPGDLYPVDPNTCKYDAFKIEEGGGTGGGDPLASGLKYYDTNGNGQWDAGEPGIPGWLIDVTDGGTAISLSPFTTALIPAGTFNVTLQDGHTYHFAERHALPFTIGGGPANGYWSQTGNIVDQTENFLNSTTLNSDKTYDVVAATDGVTTGLNFGNRCFVNPGGLTIGFWSNKNGLALITAADIAYLNSPLNLRDGAGLDKTFTGSLTQEKTAYSAWLLSANASNMAYMLSAQMSATYLNVIHGKTDGTQVVYNGLTVVQLIAYANNLLANPITISPFVGLNGGLTIAASALRTEQEAVKNAFDKINNNGGLGSFVQPDPTQCTIAF